MNEKPIHYDGSNQNNDFLDTEKITTETPILTEEIRANISGNPYIIGNIE